MNNQLYQILNVSPCADMSTIRSAYRRAALLAHPDKGGSTQRFHEVTSAFEILSNETLREAYHSTIITSKSSKHTCRPKRKFSDSHENFSRSKQTQQHSQPAAPHLTLRREKAVSRLQVLLQSFDAQLRRETMASMEPRVRRALFEHMQRGQATKQSLKNSTSPSIRNMLCKASDASNDSTARAPSSGVTGVHKFGRLYRGFAAVANMELVTRMQPCIDTAIEDQIVLVQLKGIILNHIEFPKMLLTKLQECLARNGTSEKKMQLRAKVRVRASHWMGTKRVSSPLMRIAQAIALRSKLLHSRRISWDSFRSECVPLLQRLKYHRAGQTHRSHEQAELVADKAWASCAIRRQAFEEGRKKMIMRVLQSVRLALDLEERWAAKAKARILMAEKRRAGLVKAEKMQNRDELRRWLRRSDLTMEEIIQGPPEHLRHNYVQKAPG